MKATWKTQEEFSALLIHPKMFLDHEPRHIRQFVHLLEQRLGLYLVGGV